MGQYYKYLTIGKNGIESSGDSWSYNNGAKLMEHSYIGNDFVNSCLTRIFCNPSYVAWIGDYSEDGSCVYNDKAENFNNYYVKVWGKYNPETKTETPPTLGEQPTMNKEDMIEFDMDKCNYYLSNHSKKICLNIEKYVEQNKWHGEGNWHNYETDKDEHYSYDMCINPLPLLTACGNGQGGGDYCSDVGQSDIGSWALDLIELVKDKPFGYKEVEYSFIER